MWLQPVSFAGPVRSSFPDHPARADVVLAVVLLALGLLAIRLEPGSQH
jgi:hypothetical protein